MFFFYVVATSKMVTALKMVACGGRGERQKLAIASLASTLGLVALIGGHDGAPGVEEKLMVMRGMVVIFSGATCDCGDRERIVAVKRKRVTVVERERSSVVCL